MAPSSRGVNPERSENDPLLRRFLARENLPASAVDLNAAWLNAPDHWLCPGCRRSKWQIAWISRRGRVTAKLVEHHDHVHDLSAFDCWGDVAVSDRIILNRISQHAEVFEPTLACEPCNCIDVRARSIIPLPANISFSPAEIRRFIVARPHRQHEIDAEKLKAVWERRVRAESRRRHFVEWSIRALREGSHWRQLGVASLDEMPEVA
jgi:hypothetical protein